MSKHILLALGFMLSIDVSAALVTERWNVRFVNLSGNGVYDAYFKFDAGDTIQFDLSYDLEDHYYSQTNLSNSVTSNICDPFFTGPASFCDSQSTLNLNFANVSLASPFEIFDFAAIAADGYTLSTVLNNSTTRIFRDNNGGFDFSFEDRGQRVELFSGTFGIAELFIQPSDPQAPWERPRFTLEFLSSEIIDNPTNPPSTSVPTPTTYILFISGLVLLLQLRLKKKPS